MKHNHNSLNVENKRTVLVAPLDWGLGHATRCVPIIKELLIQNFEVFVAASGKPLELLKKEFPNLNFLTIGNYNIRYSKARAGFTVKLLYQLPKVMNAIRNEKKWIKTLLNNYKVDILISDNRPGLYHPGAYCIYITHQINIKSGNKIADFIINKIHHHFIKQYNQCWIPDTKTGGLSGRLGHPVSKKINAEYINPLSRFINAETSKQFDIAILLSGPEPQRTILETIIFQQIKDSTKKIIVVRGLLLNNQHPSFNSNIRIINHLSASQLNEIVCGSSLIISRCGYTSIMDFVKLQKNAVLIPTPGQKEQEYLAQYLAKENYFLIKHQEKFDLEAAWNEAQFFKFRHPQIDFNRYKKFIADLSGINT